MSVYLVLTSPSIGTLKFEMQDGFESGYESEFKALADKQVTHPYGYQWRAGKVSNFDVKFELAVGAQYALTSPRALVRTIEKFYDMELPASRGRGISVESIIVSVGGRAGRAWFRQRAFIEKVRVVWKSPYDIDSGRPMRADVTLSLIPAYVKYAGRGGKTRELPKRPWKFAEQV